MKELLDHSHIMSPVAIIHWCVCVSVQLFRDVVSRPWSSSRL